MPKNRLQLNFDLESAEDRTQFVQEYMAGLKFEPTEAELETISNYILWGKASNGKNAQQNGEVEIKKWADSPVESLEALAESPGFSETSLRSLREPPARIQRTTFNRQAALENAPDHLKQVFIDLFRQIDELELELNYYELWSGKRKLPPRLKLEETFTEEERRIINEKALRLSQFKYLKLRHLLVELRAQQYTYYDTYAIKITTHYGAREPVLNSEIVFIGEDISIYPIGLKTDSSLSQKIFRDDREPAPNDFTDGELLEIAQLLWKPQTPQYIDFTKPEHVLNVYLLRADLRDEESEDPHGLYGSAARLLRTLEYYETRANLTPLQKDLLEQKLHNIPNLDIAKYLNKTYNKTYNENYISTIFHQKIIPQIAAAASAHREILENIFYPENFKRCRDCGRVLLMTSDNFVRQKKSSDGFAPRCKQCEKIKRKKRNEANK